MKKTCMKTMHTKQRSPQPAVKSEKIKHKGYGSFWGTGSGNTTLKYNYKLLNVFQFISSMLLGEVVVCVGIGRLVLARCCSMSKSYVKKSMLRKKSKSRVISDVILLHLFSVVLVRF